MSEEEKHKPVYDEDGEDTDSIVDEKDPYKESTGDREDYQHVVDPETGKRTGKVITDDGRIMTEQPRIEPRIPVMPPAEGGLSLEVHFPNIDIDVGDIHAPDLNIHEPLFSIDIPQPLIDIDIPQPLVDIDVTEPLMNIDIPQPLVDIEVTEPLIKVDIPQPIIDIDIREPLIDIPSFPEWPAMPEKLIDIDITEPLISLPEEELIRIVGPLIEMPEWPEEGLINIGDITMPEVVGIEFPEIPEPIMWGGIGVGALIGLGILLLGIGKTAGAVKGIIK